MKILQDSQEHVWELEGPWGLQTIEHRPEKADSIILLLHGYNERGKRIFRRLRNHLPDSAHIIAPNGPFPLPRLKPDRIDFGHAWYFFDRFQKHYPIDQRLAVTLLKALLLKVNPHSLPVTIIGFSQGGYLAPLVGYEEPLTKKVIGIGCEFKAHFFKSTPHFSLVGIHGEEDKIVSPLHAKHEIDKLHEKGIKSEWHLIPDLAHEINAQAALKVKEIYEAE